VVDQAGEVKVLDFGLAKLLNNEPPGEGAVDQDALTLLATRTHSDVIIGTPLYLSPEQAMSQPVDARSDIFALGAVLYEMLTGKRPFNGKTKASLIAAIVKEDPRPIADFQPLTPPALQHVVDKCLAKDPDRRYQSMKEVAIELEELRQTSSLHESVHHTASGAGAPISDSSTLEPSSSPATAAGTPASTISSSEFISAKIKSHKKGFIVAAVVAAIVVTVGVLKLIGVGFGLAFTSLSEEEIEVVKELMLTAQERKL
jgi:serine/threonine protein kinase